MQVGKSRRAWQAQEEVRNHEKQEENGRERRGIRERESTKEAEKVWMLREKLSQEML